MAENPRYEKPVRSAALFASTEMQLRHTNESEIRHSGVDEGVGRGFDDMDPSASAEREIWVTGDVAELLDWYEARLSQLGWRLSERELDRSFGQASAWFRRNFGESILVQVSLVRGSLIIPPGDRHWGRVTYLVAGEWPAGGRPKH